MTYPDLTDSQLIDLLKLRLQNEKSNSTITDITISEKKHYKINDEFVVGYIVKSEEWADEHRFICFNRFYPNEFLFLQSIGIKFI